jgi:hypothetical protein
MLTGFRCAAGTSRVTAHVIRRGHRFYARLGHCGAGHLPEPGVGRIKAGFARSEAAAAATILSGRFGVRRNRVQSNRRNGTVFRNFAPPGVLMKEW